MNFDELDRNDLVDVELFLGVPIIETFEQYSVFIENDAPAIRSFFEGDNDNVVARQFKRLDVLVDRVERTLNDLKNNREDLNLYKHWVILENLEEALLSLNTLQNYALWSRSNKNINIYAGQIEVEYIQQQQETIEQIEIKKGSQDPNNTWYQTAIRNTLQEEEYDAEGGKVLKILINNVPTAFLESVIAQIDNGFKSFGIDIDKEFKFVGDDVAILGNKDTLMQSANILLNLRRGDNPALPNLGLDQMSILGKSKSSLLFPIIFRQIIEVFSTDDTFGSIEFGKIKFEQDAAFIDVTMYSRYRESIEGLIEL